MIVYGKNVAKDYLTGDKQIYKIYLQDNFNDENIMDLIRKRKIKPLIADKRKISELATGLHQGIILDVEDYKYHELSNLINDNETQTIIMLDHIEDPHNLGAIIRTVEAAGLDGIIIPKNRSVEVNSTVLKTSAGTAEKVKIAQVGNLNDAIATLKKQGFWIFGTDMDDASEYTKVNYNGKSAIVIGNEGKGISRLVRENCDFIIKIPMLGKVNSLNASVATGIIIYEVLRQRI